MKEKDIQENQTVIHEKTKDDEQKQLKKLKSTMGEFFGSVDSLLDRLTTSIGKDIPEDMKKTLFDKKKELDGVQKKLKEEVDNEIKAREDKSEG